jgi:hypothetical protein
MGRITVVNRITTMLLCEAGAMAFYCTGLWFKARDEQAMRLMCVLFAIKYMLYGIDFLLKTPTPEGQGDE